MKRLISVSPLHIIQELEAYQEAGRLAATLNYYWPTVKAALLAYADRAPTPPPPPTAEETAARVAWIRERVAGRDFREGCVTLFIAIGIAFAVGVLAGGGLVFVVLVSGNHMRLPW